MEQDQKFLEYVVKALAEHPEDVKINRTIDEMGVLLTLRTHRDDMGKIIGRSGATAKAIRTLLRVVGMRNEARVNLKIEEPEGGSRVVTDEDDTKEVATREFPKPQSRTLDEVIDSI
ncbi:KH domain-containing protein [bacterium]|nr:KH domain-containing protein [bacterium]